MKIFPLIPLKLCRKTASLWRSLDRAEHVNSKVLLCFYTFCRLFFNKSCGQALSPSLPSGMYHPKLKKKYGRYHQGLKWSRENGIKKKDVSMYLYIHVCICINILYLIFILLHTGCSLNIVFFSLPRQRSVAIGCTVHSHCVESFEGLLQRWRWGRGLQWIVKKAQFFLNTLYI